ncbi:MAG: molybdopterin-dependent oxidoreductase, partial [Chloroflexi bacterium]|nr:molybdopterin-dependent oxidoreductase [Chloroflexota bacterium]
MEDALRFYRFFGLRRSPEARERPDHLAVELEFLHWLAFQEAGALGQGDAAAAEPYRAATRDFLAAHTRELAEQVAAHLAERDAPFYPGLARLAAEFCAQDLEYLQGAPVSASPRLRVPASEVPLELHGLREAEPAVDASLPYSLQAVRTLPLPWDRVVKASHMTNCWYQRACAYNLFVSDGVVLREEQVGNYPPLNDPLVPDRNPRGCQKGACYTHRTYDPARLKYPLKRVGERGGGRWERISWDQALAEIADGLLDILTTDGPETILQGGGTRITNNATESVATNAFFEALGCPLPGLNVEIGDDHQGAAITLGKIIFTDSADNWFHADTILVWGGNPAYTNIPNYHYIAEARYRGARVIALAPDSTPSAIPADLWVPLNIGTDAALALAMAQVILEQRLFKEDFVREQTDLPLLVRADTGRF